VLTAQSYRAGAGEARRCACVGRSRGRPCNPPIRRPRGATPVAHPCAALTAAADVAPGQHLRAHPLAFDIFERDCAVGVDVRGRRRP